MSMTTNWQSITHSVGSMREQSRRERNGSRHKETSAINRECNEFKREFGTVKHADSIPMDKARINAEVKRKTMAQLHDDIRSRFGPRLVRRDGTALYGFQCKKK